MNDGTDGTDHIDHDEIVIETARTVRGPLVYASLVMALVPLPVLGLLGVAGSFARALVLPYLVAIGVALLAALLLTPALCAVLLGRGAGLRTSPVARVIERAFTAISPKFVRAPRAVYAAVAVLILAGLALIPQLTSNKSSLPVLQDRDLAIHWQAGPGTSLPEVTRLTTLATRDLRAVSGVRDVGSHIGRALMADQSVNVNSAEIWVSLDGKTNYGHAVAAVKDVMARYPGMRADVSTYPADRVAAVRSRASGPLVVRVYGYDLGVLAGKADDVRTMLTHVKGVTNPTVESQDFEPSLQVQVNLERAQKYGITPGDVRRASATYFAGLPVGNLYEDQKIFDVVVWGVPDARRTPADLANLLIETPSGGYIQLGAVADVKMAPAPTVYRHENISRSLDVTADVHGRDLGTVINDVKKQLAGLPMPTEFHAEVLSGTTQYDAEHWRVAAVVLAVAVAILLLLHSAFGSWRLAALQFVLLPLGVMGGVLAGSFVGGVRTVGVLAGLLAVLGLVVRNGVLLIRGYQEVDAAGPERTDTILGVTRGQLTPIVLTAALVTAVAAPFALWGTTAGTEVIHPVAVVVLGGLITSTFCSVLLLPALYLRLERRS